MFKSLKASFSYWYLQYELATNIYMFEPWEKIFLNIIFASVLGLITYSSCVYLPKYLVSLWSYYLDILNDWKIINK